MSITLQWRVTNNHFFNQAGVKFEKPTYLCVYNIPTSCEISKFAIIVDYAAAAFID